MIYNQDEKKYEAAVSVVIVNWNGKDFLRSCLESLNNQTFKDFEVIVVDNGSEDGSLEMLESDFPDVKSIGLGKNSGFCYANNLGIRKARGKYVALLNNDTKADKLWLESLVRFLDSRPEYSFASSKMICMNEPDKIDRIADSFASCGFMFGLGSGLGKEKYYKESFEIFGVCGGAAFFRNEVFEKVGAFDERYFAYLEDLDLNWRMQHAGLKGVYVPDAVVYHFGGGTSSGINNPWVIRKTVRNLWFTLSKNIPLVTGFRIAPKIILYHLYWMIKFGCVWQYILGWLSYVVQEPRFYPDRFKILRNSVLSNKKIKVLLDKQDNIVFNYLEACSVETSGKTLGKFWRWMFGICKQ